MNDHESYKETYLKRHLFSALNTVRTVPGKILQPILLCINLYACFHYVLGTTIEDSKWMEMHQVIEWIIVIWFTCEYLLRLYVQPKRITFIFSFYGIIDLLTIAPAFLADGHFIYLKALRTLRILRFLRYLEDEEFFFGSMTKMGLQVVRVVYTLITLIFISSSAIYECENLLRGGKIATYFDAVYFTVITLSTVGYGDYTPLTQVGRIITVVMILSGVIFIPWQAGKLMRIILVLSEDKRDVNCKKCGLTRHDHDAVHCKMCGEEIYQEYDGV